jgi:hypothetical protein
MYIFLKNHCEFKIGEEITEHPNLDYLLTMKVIKTSKEVEEVEEAKSKKQKAKSNGK